MHRESRSARAGAPVLVALALALAGCPAPAPPADPDPAAAATEAADRLPEGAVRLRVAKGRITLHANAAPRRDLLETLAREIGFELVARDLANTPIHARLTNAPLDEVLSRILPGRAYRLEYRAAADRHTVLRLEIASRDGRFAAPTPGGDPEAGPPPGEGRRPTLADDPDPPGVDWKSLLLRLDDSDAEERIAALEEIDPDGEGLPLIADRLARDPDPRVRVEAARKLEFSDTLAAVDALVLALEDPDRRVVLAAIEALEFTEDLTVVNDLVTLLEHPDPEIRGAAMTAIEFIRDDDGDEQP